MNDEQRATQRATVPVALLVGLCLMASTVVVPSPAFLFVAFIAGGAFVGAAIGCMVQWSVSAGVLGALLGIIVSIPALAVLILLVFAG
jgi:hypothetical protein